MKTRTFALSTVAALALLAAFLPSTPRVQQHEAAAAGSTVTLMSNQTAPGPGLATVTMQATPAPTGAERVAIQYHASAASLSVEVQESLDGSTWAAVHVFGRDADEVWEMPGCACSVRAFKNGLTTATASVFFAVTGPGVPLAPTYTATPTPTTTPTH